MKKLLLVLATIVTYLAMAVIGTWITVVLINFALGLLGIAFTVTFWQVLAVVILIRVVKGLFN